MQKIMQSVMHWLLYFDGNRQQELEAEAEAEYSKRAKKEQPAVLAWSETDKDVFFQGVLTVSTADKLINAIRWYTFHCS